VKASFFVSLPYGQVPEQVSTWPVPNRLFDPEQAIATAETHLEEVELADALGFDWIGCAEHHYSPGSLAPNVSVLAAAITQRAKRARICIMGALLPLNNPVRIAEEYALIDTLSGGRLVAGLLRERPTSISSTTCRRPSRARGSKKRGNWSCAPGATPSHSAGMASTSSSAMFRSGLGRSNNRCRRCLSPVRVVNPRSSRRASGSV